MSVCIVMLVSLWLVFGCSFSKWWIVVLLWSMVRLLVMVLSLIILFGLLFVVVIFDFEVFAVDIDMLDCICLVFDVFFVE